MPVDRWELEILAARFALGEVSRHDIYRLADRLTSEGEDSQALIDVIVEGESGEPRGLDAFLVTYLDERGVALPLKEMAPLDLAYRYAKAFVEGKLSLLLAADQIHKEAWLNDDERLWQLDPFVYWLDEVDDEFLNSREEAEEQLNDWARRLVKDFEAGTFEDWRRPENLR